MVLLVYYDKKDEGKSVMQLPFHQDQRGGAVHQCILCDSCGEDDNSMSNWPEEEDVQEALAGEPDEAPSAVGLAANQQPSRRSSYAVLSQVVQVDDVIDLTAEQAEGTKIPAASDGEHVKRCASDSESFLLCARSSKQKRDAYQDFMPMFQQMCKSASAPGELGENAMK